MRQDALALLRREITEKIEATEHAILSGLSTDWMEYRQAVARRAALREARTLVEDALDRN